MCFLLPEISAVEAVGLQWQTVVTDTLKASDEKLSYSLMLYGSAGIYVYSIAESHHHDNTEVEKLKREGEKEEEKMLSGREIKTS